MTLDNLYQIADEHNYQILGIENSDKKAFCIESKRVGVKAICMNYSCIKNQREEKSVLAEECAHLLCGFTYRIKDINNPLSRQNINQCEYQARRAAAVILVPFDEITDALNTGITEIWELAEHLDVSEDELLRAIDYYKCKLML